MTATPEPEIVKCLDLQAHFRKWRRLEAMMAPLRSAKFLRRVKQNEDRARLVDGLRS